MLDFAECERLVSTARDKRSKPIANNTRLEKHDADTYALRLHATNIATFHRDGRIILNSGGWRTVTTKDRLNGYVTRCLYSDHGVWYVNCEPDPNDPRPPRGDRSVLKPFHALDPDPEPVKPTEGCLAGTQEVKEWDEEVLTSQRELEAAGLTEDDLTRPYEHDSDYFIGYRMRHVREITEYGERAWGEAPSGAINERTRYEQCPHCKLFDQQHRAWDEAMNGGGWGRNRTHGYRAMVEALERYGSREAWQEAYIEDFRAAREARRAYKEWLERNRVMFEDGMELTPNGYAKRPDPKAIAREQRRRKTIEKKKQRINKFVADAVEALANGLPMPSGGDCWYCSMSQSADGTPMGDAMPTVYSNGEIRMQPNHEHLDSHISEHYYVPSMFVNALRERGYRDTGIYMYLAMDPDNDRMGGEWISRDSVARALRTYLYTRLIPEAYGVGEKVAA